MTNNTKYWIGALVLIILVLLGVIIFRSTHPDYDTAVNRLDSDLTGLRASVQGWKADALADSKLTPEEKEKLSKELDDFANELEKRRWELGQKQAQQPSSSEQ